ncbi:unnamed protein product, partial [Choristocarpus tenellus]
MVKLPKGYTFKAGSYVYVMCPAISPSEWHAFSLIPARRDIESISIRSSWGAGAEHETGALYVAAVGNWTKELFRLAVQNTRMPLWISNAMPSCMEHALDFDNG